MKIHPLADVQTTQIGENTAIWQYSVILKGAVIGDNCNINCHTFIENDVVIGDNVTIKAGVYLWDGIAVEDDVFIGPNVTFTNDKFPRSKIYPDNFQKIFLQKGCSIGANATILGGTVIGAYSIVAAGSLVSKSVPPFALVKGSPARVYGWLDKSGKKLTEIEDNLFTDTEGNRFLLSNGNLTQL